MNLRDRRAGQWLIAVALFFFFACEEESTLLGYRADSRFKVNFIEIPIESSVYLTDSLVTTNVGFNNRTLVGSYVDDLFGTVTTTAYSQFLPTFRVDTLTQYEYDSVTLHLFFDYYMYGSGVTQDQRLSVFYLADTMALPELGATYLNRTTEPLADKLGEKSFTIDTAKFSEILRRANDNNANNDTLRAYLKIPLSQSFGQSLFESALAWDIEKDTTYYFDSLFVMAFNGLAIKSESMDNVLGFNPSFRITVHLTRTANSKRDSMVYGVRPYVKVVEDENTGEKVSRSYNLSSFNGISAIRSGDLAGLTDNYYEELPPSFSDNRYVQNGTGVMTKLDLSNFLAFADTIPAMIINSAEFILDEIPEQPEFMKPINGIGLRPLYSTLRIRSDAGTENISAISEYRGTVTSASPIGYVTAERSSSALAMSLKEADDDSLYFSGHVTLFMQELFRNYKNGGPVFSSMVLFPTSPSIGRSVDRMYFNKNALKLRIYYTRPKEYESN